MQDSLHNFSYQLTSANGLIFLWIICGVAIVVALIIFFDPFKRRHKMEYKYPWTKRRFSFRFNPFGFIFRRIRGVYRNFTDDAGRRQHRTENRE